MPNFLHNKYLQHSSSQQTPAKNLSTLLWFADFKITINSSKAIILSHKTSTDTPRIDFGQEAIPWSKTIKYLGITIDNKIKFNTYINIINCVQFIKRKLCRLINPQVHSLSNPNFIYTRPTSAQLYYSRKQTGSQTYPKLAGKPGAVQSTILKYITNNFWYASNLTIRNTTLVPSISDAIKTAKLAQRQHTQNSSYPHIADFLNRPSRPSSKELFIRRPLSILN